MVSGENNNADLANTDDDGNIVIAGYDEGARGHAGGRMLAVTPGYFATMQVALLTGLQTIQRRQRMWPSCEPHHRLATRQMLSAVHPLGGEEEIQCVGVAGDTRHARVRDEPHGVSPALPVGQPQRADIPGAYLAAARGRALQHPRRHVAAQLQDGVEQPADHGCADWRQPLRGTAGSVAGRELWRTGDAFGCDAALAYATHNARAK